uniref:Uncharacterized protein n=1 Tax=Labrus bergylta TaxID=56723 RepID=A0A3Q3FPN2_9LABR
MDSCTISHIYLCKGTDELSKYSAARYCSISKVNGLHVLYSHDALGDPRGVAHTSVHQPPRGLDVNRSGAQNTLPASFPQKRIALKCKLSEFFFFCSVTNNFKQRSAVKAV